jgi:hypothetical protein
LKPYKIPILISAFILTSCFPTTRFYVRNKTDKPVHFIVYVNFASQEKNRMAKFVVQKDTSVLVRKLGLSKKATLHDVFYNLKFDAADSVKQNPNDFKNWVKSENQWGKPIYIFTATK